MKYIALIAIIATTVFPAGCSQQQTTTTCAAGQVLVNGTCVSAAQLPVCGNHLCEMGEQVTCAQDCPVANPCGNGAIDSGETCSTCPADVHCSTNELCTNGACVPIAPTVECTDSTGCSAAEKCVSGSCVARVLPLGNCSVLSQDCTAGTKCVYLYYGAVCTEAGTKAMWANCAYDNECPAGTRCVEQRIGQSICSPYCRTDVPADCRTGTMCGVIASSDVGLCSDAVVR